MLDKKGFDLWAEDNDKSATLHLKLAKKLSNAERRQAMTGTMKKIILSPMS